MTEPNLATTHSQYPDGFPARPDDGLLGHWRTPQGVVVVEDHPHGYEIHFYPCYDFDRCEACSPHRGPANPHTGDGHHFRLCQRRGHVLTVAGDASRSVLEYLAMEESPPHVAELDRIREREAAAVAEERLLAREEQERDLAERELYAPSPAERLAALKVEMDDLREQILRGQS